MDIVQKLVEQKVYICKIRFALNGINFRFRNMLCVASLIQVPTKAHCSFLGYYYIVVVVYYNYKTK